MSGLKRVLRKAMPGFDPKLVFDVGANVGQSVEEFRTLFPKAHIHAFEPVPATFTELSRNVGRNGGVTLHQFALSDVDGTAVMRMRGTSVSNAILAPGQKSRNTDTVHSVRGDHFCAENQIDAIDFLKIDAEGHDLKVLAGFGGLLEKGAVTLLQVEAGFNPENTLHVSYDEHCRYLLPLGYRVLQVINQVLEKDRPVLRRGNVLFAKI